MARLAWVVEIGSVSYPDSLFASCGRLPYPYADRSRHVWNPSPSLTDDARVRHACLTDDKGNTTRPLYV
ncbi:MAG: hypothetical protein IIT33_01705 [Prevotella sp.]|nr:hypothetical protein [Prevotella sp.]